MFKDKLREGSTWGGLFLIGYGVTRIIAKDAGGFETLMSGLSLVCGVGAVVGK